MPRQPFWARPLFVAGAIALYLAIHFTIRMTQWPTLGLDDSEQALFAQRFAWSYRFRAPPLFTWMLVSLGQVMPVDIASISLIRYALLGITFGFAYLTARRLIDDPRLAALSIYAFAAIYVFGYYSHHDLTHTTALAAMLSVAWYVFVRLCASPRIGWYLALGAVCGLGLLAKWNFLMFVAALALACLADRRFRGLILSWNAVAAILTMIAIVLPTVLTALRLGPAARDNISAVLGSETDSYAARLPEGTLKLASAILVYPQPMLLLVLALFGAALWRGRHAGPSVDEARTDRPDARLIGSVMAISLALHLALVVFAGATGFSERLMQPPLFILPVWLFMLIERGEPSPRLVTASAAIFALVATGFAVARAAVYLRGADHCGTCRAMVPFERLARDLSEAGFSGRGTILVDGFPVGGNMRVTFPEARILDIGYRPETWPEPFGAPGQCMLVWQERSPEQSARVLAELEDYLAVELGGDTRAAYRDGVVAGRMFRSETKDYRLAYRIYGSNGACR